MDFKDFNLKKEVLQAVGMMGFKEPTYVQRKAIPVILDQRDVVICAQTGTGKTAAYLIPVLQKLNSAEYEKGKITALVMVPTRELAQQIDQQMQGLFYYSDITSLSVYGGGASADWDVQKKAIVRGAEIIVATPGRLLSHLSFGYTDLSHVEFFVLDEADRMLDMGFHEDITKIIRHLPAKRQNILLSATMPPEIRKLADIILSEPVTVNIKPSRPADNIMQAVYFAEDAQKLPLIEDLLRDKKEESILIFCSTRAKVRDVANRMKRMKLDCDTMSSDHEQSTREEVLRKFRNRKTKILVATDVIARGIDIMGIDLIINYDVPRDPEDYIHRIGRTARAELSGVAITFVSRKEKYLLKRIEGFLEKQLFRIPLPAHLH